jgi:CrcB protein
MTLGGFLAVGLGGAMGCWLRWLAGIFLNPLFANMLLGTLAVNLLGGYLIGLAVEFFSHHDSLPPEWRLFVVVGFLGGLTTFSSFSAEAVDLLRDRDYLWSFVVIGTHLLGSLAMTFLGICSVRALNA